MAPHDTPATASAHLSVIRRLRSAARAAGALLWVLAFGHSAPVAAWGDEGHEVVGLIAEHFLEPEVERRVTALLATDTSGLTVDTSIASETTWADRFRDSDRASTQVRYRGTRNWHFVDLELAGADLDAACAHAPPLAPSSLASEGPAEDCVVHKIEEFRRELAGPTTTAPERLRALQFLLHLVADVHQPLHAADDHDRGGNAKRIEDPEGAHGTLHYYWDTGLVRHLGSDPERVAAALIAQLSAADYARYGGGTAALWAMESYAVAREYAYGALPPALADGRFPLSEAYVASGTEVVRRQLERAGLRLAGLLNAALR
jgi:hypothetical protein